MWGEEDVRALFFHVDGKLPSYSGMRMAHHFRSLGWEFEIRRAGNVHAIEPRLDDSPHDLVFASIIFERSRPVAERIREIYPNAHIGGTGWDLTTKLSDFGCDDDGPLDYSDYPNWKQSIGWTMRGCRLKCEFCVVPRKEGKARPASTIAEIYRGAPHPPEIILLDNDFFGGANWVARINEMIAGRFKVCFCQGINARMLHDETAAAIASVDYRDTSMKTKRIYTAWDGKKDERTLFRGLEALVKHGVKPDQIMVYILIGFEPGETHEDRDYRRQKLRDFGARPYPMPFVREPELVGFQRWVIGAYDKGISWRDWCGAKYEPRKLGNRKALKLFEDN